MLTCEAYHWTWGKLFWVRDEVKEVLQAYLIEFTLTQIQESYQHLAPWIKKKLGFFLNF